MKKSLALFATIVLGASLLGCSEKSTWNGQVGQDPPSQNQNQNQTPNQNNQPPAQNNQGQQPTKPADDGVIRGWKTGSGQSLTDKKLRNDAYEITHIQRLNSGTGFQVKGKLRAFEAVGAVRLLGPDGKGIVQPDTGREEIVIMASEGAPAWGDFTAQVKYPDTLKGKVGTLEFYVHSAKDGSKQNILSVQIELE
ncbi:Gmad2 immunoglobulin-like domain-containing protein [Effusibacillus consociatus]|uniref:Gmad2 immunoglobulin-like domain-containing protein n=1 Tax=Effusibacillus consociatus TaxID=1117041 RepID=A0ABV9Q4J8_9BACL